MDSPFANRAFAESLGVTFPLLSDWGGDVTRAYGVYNPVERAPRRATFLIDKSGKVSSAQFDKEAIDPTAIVKQCTIAPANE